MSLLPMYKKCRKCKKKYSFNPDVGRGLSCPYCGYRPKDPMAGGQNGIPILGKNQKDYK